MPVSFNLSLDRPAIIITVATTLSFVWLSLFVLIPAFVVESRPVGILGLVIVVCTYSLAVLYRPLRYEITSHWLFIQRPIGKFSIDLKAIQEIRHLTQDEMKFTVRTFGIGGLFGYVGFFSNDKVGGLRLFASRQDQTILLKLDNNQNIVLTPDDPIGMIQYLKTLGVPTLSKIMPHE